MAALLFTLVATLFVCHVSVRLVHASANLHAFRGADYVDPVPFSTLVLFSAYLYIPSSYNACINYLRQIDGAKQLWAEENHKKPGNKVTWEDIASYLKGGKRTWCPHGGLYIIGSIDEDPRCTIKEHKLP